MAEDMTGWTNEARVALIEVARVYHATTTYGDLARRIQDRTNVYTNQLLQNWIGEPLARVSAECARRGEPLLSALCVYKADDTVGRGYADAVEQAYGHRPADVETHAAEERLKCYRHFNAVGLPDNGGVAALTTKVAQARTKAHNKDQTQRRERDITKICAVCQQVPSISGACGCD